MSRLDLSPYLIHFTSDESTEKAFKRLQKIIFEKRIIGNNRLIRGGYKCVCFSEAPISSLSNGLINPRYYSRYSPFGVLFPKSWIFSKGGRPVIYQTEEEFNSLPVSHKWRHVLYRPDLDETIDFSWEREWRIKCDYLEFGPDIAQIVVLDKFWAKQSWNAALQL